MKDRKLRIVESRSIKKLIKQDGLLKTWML